MKALPRAAEPVGRRKVETVRTAEFAAAQTANELDNLNGVAASPDTRRPSATDTIAIEMQVNTTSPEIDSVGNPMNVSATIR